MTYFYFTIYLVISHHKFVALNFFSIFDSQNLSCLKNDIPHGEKSLAMLIGLPVEPEILKVTMSSTLHSFE